MEPLSRKIGPNLGKTIFDAARHIYCVGRDIRQAGAICLRREGDRLIILLVGSRRNGRWGIPKGHIDPGETSSRAAGREAFEEAGVIGDVHPEALDSFSYRKDSTPHRYHVAVHLLEVSSVAIDFPEKGERRQQWFPLEDGMREVSQRGLREVLAQLAQKQISS